ncbi:serine/threonine protein phosphatase [Shewanella sp. 202IG2-18]|uniref:lipopolysaccharide kinase InaA family protein n=1 Tax=Parashewanella hymeniacidonis TaxID=2807618 RepID=UPI001961D7A0|nr:lipopolysaccharide kinase InaA family protein [Parashewanella hymeniacidonis]MBM7072815.1 serine/threonine protein phosphatase [Parashewanella hymeniacidonis]
MNEKLTFQEKLDHELKLHEGDRVSTFEYEDQKYWLKQTEQVCGIMKLLKGDANRALRREVCKICKLERRHAPVPHIVCKQKNLEKSYFVIEDSGKTLKDWLNDPDCNSEQLKQILFDSAKALAELHLLKFAHGRPALRDICWRNGKVTFIDFESNIAHMPVEERQVRDLFVFIHSLYRYLGVNVTFIDGVINHYRKVGGEAVWQQSQQQIRKWQWLYYLAYLFRFKGGRDIKPIYWVLKHFKEAPRVRSAEEVGA